MPTHRFELAQGVVGVDHLDRRMPRARAGFRLTPRSSRKTAVGRRDVQLACRPGDRSAVGFAHADHGRLDHGVEQGQDIGQCRAGRGRDGVTKLLVSSPVLKCCGSDGRPRPSRAQLAREQWRTGPGRRPGRRRPRPRLRTRRRTRRNRARCAPAGPRRCRGGWWRSATRMNPRAARGPFVALEGVEGAGRGRRRIEEDGLDSPRRGLFSQAAVQSSVWRARPSHSSADSTR